ncbi:MAG TPA: 2-amino-4-hydroxy-6-hydroxymethyldihydropteridine diphosphokinase [Actinomycetota bacterium]
MPVVTLGLGANLGDRLAALQRAVDLLAEEGVRTVASSRVWETAPVGGPKGQPRYLNAVVLAETTLSPEEVLAAAHRVEDALDRVRVVRWGPRTIDVDVLLYDDLVRDDPDLTIPHPRMTQRAFVIMPLLEVDPDPVLPDGRRVVDLPAPDGDAQPFAAPLRSP